MNTAKLRLTQPNGSLIPGGVAKYIDVHWEFSDAFEIEPAAYPTEKLEMIGVS